MNSIRTRRWTRSAVAATLLAAVCLCVPVSSTSADGLTNFYWSNSQKTLSSTSYRYSNMTGLWQAILNSNAAGLSIDGNFGSVTGTATNNWRNAIGAGSGTSVTPSVWSATQNAVDGVYAPYRLNSTGYVDGYGTAHYSYYGGSGGCSSARLGWNPIVSQWLFGQYPSNPGALVNATIARTISGVAACS